MQTIIYFIIIMQELNKEQLDFMYKTIDCKMSKIICERNYHLSKQDKEDIRSFVVENTLKRWRYFDATKSKWNTFLVLCIDCSLATAWQWWWRYKWRLPFEEMPEDAEEIFEVPPDSDNGVEELIDNLVEDETSREILWLRYQGYKNHEIKQMGYKKYDWDKAYWQIESAFKRVNKKRRKK